MILLALLLATPHMTWHGGRVLEQPHFFNIYWGNYWGDHLDQVSWFDGFTRTVAPSTELASQVTEYSVNGQVLGASVFAGSVIVRDEPGSLITDSDLENFIQTQIQSHTAPAVDDHIVYSVFLAPGVKIQNEDKAVGYHTRSDWGFHEIMIHFDNYVLDVASRDVAAVTYSHEMAETITDPDLDGWYDDALGIQGEIGDVCEGHLALAGGYSIQQEWSEADGKCMASRSVPIPPSGGLCPDGLTLQNGTCSGYIPGWGCSSAASGFPALLGLLALAFFSKAAQRRARRA